MQLSQTSRGCFYLIFVDASERCRQLSSLLFTSEMKSVNIKHLIAENESCDSTLQPKEKQSATLDSVKRWLSCELCRFLTSQSSDFAPIGSAIIYIPTETRLDRLLHLR